MTSKNPKMSREFGTIAKDADKQFPTPLTLSGGIKAIPRHLGKIPFITGMLNMRYSNL